MTRRKVFVMCVGNLIIGLLVALIAMTSVILGKAARPNVVTGDTDMKDAEYGIFPTILSVCHSPGWLIDMGANVHV